MYKRKPSEHEKRTIGIWAKIYDVPLAKLIELAGPNATRSTYTTRKNIERLIEKISKKGDGTLEAHAKRLRMKVEELIKIVDPWASPTSLYPKKAIKEILLERKGRKKIRRHKKPVIKKNPLPRKSARRHSPRFFAEEDPTPDSKNKKPAITKNPLPDRKPAMQSGSCFSVEETIAPDPKNEKPVPHVMRVPTRITEEDRWRAIDDIAAIPDPPKEDDTTEENDDSLLSNDEPDDMDDLLDTIRRGIGKEE